MSARARFAVGNHYQYLNISFAVEPNKSQELGTTKENNLSATYRLGTYYTNYNLTIGGFMNPYSLQNETPFSSNVQPLQPPLMVILFKFPMLYYYPANCD